MKAIQASARQLLVSLVIYTGLVKAVSPSKQDGKSMLPSKHPEESRMAPSKQVGSPSMSQSKDFKWAVTSFHHSEEQGTQIRTEPSDQYIERVKSSPATEHEYIHSLHPLYHPGVSKALTRNIRQAHAAKRINDVEYSVYKHNVLTKSFGRHVIERGHAVRIGETVHHPTTMHQSTVAADYHNGKTANMILTRAPGVRMTDHGTTVHAMTLLDAPPKHLQHNLIQASSSRPAPTAVHSSAKAVKEEPHNSDEARRYLTPDAQKIIGGLKPLPRRTTWHVTSRVALKTKGSPLFKTEEVEDYREHLGQQLETERRQGKKGIDAYSYTPDPVIHDPINHDQFLANVLQTAKDAGHSQDRLNLIDNNERHLGQAWKFINEEKGAVYFPDSIHHPGTMHPLEALRPREGTKVGHMKVYRENAIEGETHRLQFVPSRHAALGAQSSNAGGSKQARTPDADNSNDSANKKQRNV